MQVRKKNRSVILFVRNSITEIRDKNLFHGGKTKKVLDAFTEKITLSVLEANKKLEFDFIISTDSKNDYPSIYKISDNNCLRIYQQGNNFGERFVNTLSAAFSFGYEEVIILGNDAPEISASHILKTFDELNKNDCTVIGPAQDGGFYLLGLTTFNKNIFNGIPWQTDDVLSQLKENIKRVNHNFILIETLCDIDNRNDLFQWLSAETPFGISLKKQIISDANPNQTFELKPSLFKKLKQLRRITQKAPPVFTSSL